jgi:hypothetical protein
MRKRWVWWLIAVAVAGSWGAPGATAQQRNDQERRLVEILEGLEHGLVALERLGLREEHDRLQRVANDIRGELRFHRRRGGRDLRERTELQVVESQIGALKLALPALREAERRDAAEMVERAIEARKMVLEGRRDEEIRWIREHAPGREQIVELLVLAERIYREFGMNERAAELSRMTEELWPGRDRPRERPRAGPNEEAIHALEVMRMGMAALEEAGRHDSAELLERAIRAREVQLEGRRDREAAEIREQAPTLGQQIELLAYAAELWQEFGHERKAEVISELVERMRSMRPGDLRRGRGEPRRDALLPRVERLERRLAELERDLEEIRAQIRAPSRRRR